MVTPWHEPDQVPYTFSDLSSPNDDLPGIVNVLSQPGFHVINKSYRHWRKVKRIARDEGLDPELAWKAVKFTRFAAYRKLSLRGSDGTPFGYSTTPMLHHRLHRVDQVAATGSFAPTLFEPDRGVLGSDDARSRFLIRTLMDEAIDSSRIEGAVTTRHDARRLLRSGKAPKTKYERMVVNNYRGMRLIKTWLGDELTPDRLKQLQAALTEGTLDTPDQSGRYRRPGEDVRVVDARTNEAIYTPPPAETLDARIEEVCAFANHPHTGNEFIHPILKASILHFLIGYEHPFADGNGRTARAVFYWSALRSGYRVLEYTVISELILKGFAAYPRAFLDTESDENDLTYFLLYKARIIERALDQLELRLREEDARLRRSLRLARTNPDLNLRQRLILEHVLRRPNAVYTARSHANASRITPVTARADLEGLVASGYFGTYKIGAQVQYVPVDDLEIRLGEAG